MIRRWLRKGLAMLLKLLFIGRRRKFAAINIITGHAQHIGEREQQQDTFYISTQQDSEMIKQPDVLAILADGMGGMAMGREAGELAVQTMLNEYRKRSAEETVPQALERALHRANQTVFELALDHDLEWNVGTTLIAAVIQEEQLYWISAGDSRIYLYKNSELVQLTRDHNYGNRLDEYVASGTLAREEAEMHQDRHLLTSYLGIPEITEISANQAPIHLSAGDWILLCSDGIYEELSELLLEEAATRGPAEAAEFILQHVLAQQNPYQDNATIVILACCE
ncbi:protein phosphatase [Paenibacillus castaneae]|uniref:PP2C family protein-serine/threonine phosphatase n=1 Tax=Paenibacillus castaneae TaxID=474957 RepID=UPI000C998627|nr:protein phosphatase 2C domain-containing protein [Paenibacillus castaneae]NIK79496.1 protein phosphatase [Paenibacillus castaneae]